VKSINVETLEHNVKTNLRLNQEKEKALLSIDCSSYNFVNWQEAYWDAKYIDKFCNQDSEYDRNLLCLLNESLINGLTFYSNRILFFDASFSLARLQFKYRNYRLAENHLMLIRELTDHASKLPNWVSQYSAITYFKLNLSHIFSKPLEFFEIYASIPEDNEEDRVQKIYILKDFINNVIEYTIVNSIIVDNSSAFVKAFNHHLSDWLPEIDDEWSELLHIEKQKQNIFLEQKISINENETKILLKQKDDEIKSLQIIFENLQRNNQLLQSQVEELIKIESTSSFEEKLKEDILSKTLENQQLKKYLTEVQEELRLALSENVKLNETVLSFNEEAILEQQITEPNMVTSIIEKSDDLKGSTEYSVRKRDLKILLFGDSQVRKNDLYGIAKNFGLSIDQLELRTDYDKNKNFDIRGIQYKCQYSGILIGAISHSSKGKGDYSSIVETLQKEGGYPLNIALRDCNGALKVTKENFKKGLNEILTALKSADLA